MSDWSRTWSIATLHESTFRCSKLFSLEPPYTANGLPGRLSGNQGRRRSLGSRCAHCSIASEQRPCVSSCTAKSSERPARQARRSFGYLPLMNSSGRSLSALETRNSPACTRGWRESFPCFSPRTRRHVNAEWRCSAMTSSPVSHSDAQSKPSTQLRHSFRRFRSAFSLGACCTM